MTSPTPTLDWRASTWSQFGAAIDMLNDIIDLCPASLWTAVVWHDPDDERYGQFWFVVYHTLKWLDLNLNGTMDGFAPPPPFLAKGLPDQPYTREQLLAYLRLCREKCRVTLEGLSDERARQRCVYEWMQPTFFELMLYSMRHVQEHTAQLSLLLGQHGVTGMDWVASAR
jgi:DinB superfamily